MLKSCEECGKPFSTDAGWKKVCVLCWKESKDYDLTLSDKAFKELQDVFLDQCIALDAAREEIEALNAELDELEADVEKWKRRANSLRAKLNASNAKADSHGASPVALSALDIRNLLKLCHPDKHGNSELANTMTKLLLDMRKA